MIAGLIPVINNSSAEGMFLNSSLELFFTV